MTQSLIVPMRDGIQLALDVIAPRGDGPYPVVLIRTMYDKVDQRDAVVDPGRGIPYDGGFVAKLVDAGYALAVQDVRGRFDSDGDWHPYMHEREDGFDTVEWIADQSWCDGNIGMIGRSYVGYTQWMAAVDRPRGLKAIVPISPQADLYHGYPIVNGAFLLAMGELGIKGGRHSFQIRDFMRHVTVGPEPYFDTLPICDMFQRAGVTAPPWWTEMMNHPDRDEYWARGGYAGEVRNVNVASLGVTGWFDLVVDGAIENFAAAQVQNDAEARRHELIVGPWAHWVNVRANLSGVEYGADSLIDLEGVIVSFFDRWLTNREATQPEKAIHIFVMGANEWWNADAWPLPETDTRSLYLRGDGDGGVYGVGGRLSFAEPLDEPPDTYTYDPRQPVTSDWSMHAGPVDDTATAHRNDVLTYTTEPLVDPLDVVGRVSLVLHASSSARDTDWHVRLIDVDTTGEARFISHGVLRARYRESYAEPKLLEPGVPTRFEIPLTPTAIRFAPGHRIGVEVMSSWFPRFERNMNTGSPNNHLDGEPRTAQQTIFHDATRRSRLVLPVIPPGSYQPSPFAPREATK
jgi:uncharacterized protein